MTSYIESMFEYDTVTAATPLRNNEVCVSLRGLGTCVQNDT